MRFVAPITVLLISGLLAWYVFSTNTPGNPHAIKLGLDLAGGTELIYKAQTENVVGDTDEALRALRKVIERRVNLFGVAEPLVQLETSSAVAGEVQNRLLVELPGVTDVGAAVDALGKTPLLEFKLLGELDSEGNPTFIPTELTGRYLERAELQFGSASGQGLANEAIVVLTFTGEGASLFEQITKDNVGSILAIFLDGTPISTPVIREAISGGTATISGQFTPEEGRDLVQNLNFGALPVPIELVGSSSVGPTLGGTALAAGIDATIIGFALVAVFMIAWYRLPGLVSVFALFIYVIITIAIIKFIPVTLTASGIAGFILSIGMAVDANVLIFERMKEELKSGKAPKEAAHTGFSRAWPAIRDGHFTMIISSAILFWMGTSIVKGFALVFGLGVIVSLLSAVTITQVFLNVILPKEGSKTWKLLLSSGLQRT